MRSISVSVLAASISRPDQGLRERNYAGWISLDFNYVDMPPGVTIEQDMAAHRKYLVETLHASLKT